MTTDQSTKQSIASNIASLALNPAEILGNTIAEMISTPSSSSFQKGQITQSLDHYENGLISSKKSTTI